jgi:hypothetical protein
LKVISGKDLAEDKRSFGTEPDELKITMRHA